MKNMQLPFQPLHQCTEVRFATFLSDGFTSMAVINPLERKVTRRTPELICSNEPDETRFSATNSTLYSTDLQDHPVRRSSAQCYKKA